MIKSKTELIEWIDYERKKYGVSSYIYIYILKLICGSENATIFHLQKRLRKTEYFKNTNKKIRYVLSKIKLNKLENKYSIHISPNSFDKGLKIMHLGPILVNGKVKIGKDCSIHINTSIVAGGSNDGIPSIGNNLVIGVGCVLCGEIRIGDNVAIGANSFVNKSFADGNCTIAGSPAKIISNKTSNDWGKKG